MPNQNPHDVSIPFTADLLLIGCNGHTLTLTQRYSDVMAQIRLAFNAGEALKLFMQKRPDCIIIDSDISEDCGQPIIRHFRQFSTASIIQIGHSHQREDRVKALVSGADYYLTQPIYEPEFAVVLKNAFRHARIIQTIYQQPNEHWSCCRLEHRLYSPEGRDVTLTPNELRIIEVIAAHGEAPVIERQAFAIAFKRTNSEGFEKLLHVGVGRLRKKILDQCQVVFPLKSSRSIGYCFESKLAILP